MNVTERSSCTTSRAALDAAVLSAAVALVAMAVGTLSAVFESARLVAAHGYAELDFERCTSLVVAQTLRAGAHGSAGVVLGQALVAGAVAFCFARRFGRWNDSASTQRALAWPTSLAWFTAAAAFAVLLGLAWVHSRSRWFGARDFVFAATFVAAWSAVVALGMRCARRASEAHALDTLHAASGALAALFLPSFWVGSRLSHAPFERATWVTAALAALGAALVFLWIRARDKHVREGRTVSPWRGPVGGAALACAGFELAVVLWVGRSGAWAKPSLTAANPQNVVVLAIDTVRVDATSITGLNARGRDTTPNLRRLAERGVVFENAISQAPWTLPAFASILTGKYPHEHGAYNITGRLRERETTLAEVLHEAGYDTVGAISQYYLRSGSGFDQGCERYDESGMTRVDEIGSERTTDAALRLFTELGARPFFAFVHYYDPHADYLDHPEFDWADGYQGWLREQGTIENLVRSRDVLDAADLRYVVDLFDEELAHTDRHLGRLLDEFDRRDLWRDTLVVLVVDHGEQFLDHGGFEHTVNVFEELVHVPLVIVPPGSTSGTRFTGVVETRDVFATVLDVLDIDFAASVRPRNLLRTAAQPPSELARAFTITWPEDAEPAWGVRSFVSGLRTPRFKAIHDWTRERRMLFDLAQDPRELRDVSGEHPAIAEELVGDLDRWTDAQRKSSTGAASANLDSAGVRMLQSLGYMGGGGH